MAKAKQEQFDAYVEAYGDWCRAATHHWMLAQQKLEGECINPDELMAVVDEFDRTHRRLVAMTDRL